MGFQYLSFIISNLFFNILLIWLKKSRTHLKTPMMVFTQNNDELLAIYIYFISSSSTHKTIKIFQILALTFWLHLQFMWLLCAALVLFLQIVNNSIFKTKYIFRQSGTTQHGGRKVGNKKKSGKHLTFYHPKPRPTTPAAYVGHINVFIPKLKY